MLQKIIKNSETSHSQIFKIEYEPKMQLLLCTTHFHKNSFHTLTTHSQIQFAKKLKYILNNTTQQNIQNSIHNNVNNE